MEYVVFIIIALVVISMFSGGSGKNMECPQCGKNCSHTFIESLKGHNRISDYYKCNCCGDRWSNDKFFD